MTSQYLTSFNAFYCRRFNCYAKVETFYSFTFPSVSARIEFENIISHFFRRWNVSLHIRHVCVWEVIKHYHTFFLKIVQNSLSWYLQKVYLKFQYWWSIADNPRLREFHDILITWHMTKILKKITFELVSKSCMFLHLILRIIFHETEGKW